MCLLSCAGVVIRLLEVFGVSLKLLLLRLRICVLCIPKLGIPFTFI